MRTFVERDLRLLGFNLPAAAVRRFWTMLAHYHGQTKAPKIYIRDSGLFHTLMGLPDRRTVLAHPKLGASWEGFALEQVIARFPTRDTYFWSTRAGAELDLFMMSGGKRIGFEFKFNDAPSTTKSMRIALADLKLDHLWVVHPGQHRHPLDDRIEAIGLAELATRVTRIAGRAPQSSSCWSWG